MTPWPGSVARMWTWTSIRTWELRGCRAVGYSRAKRRRGNRDGGGGGPVQRRTRRGNVPALRPAGRGGRRDAARLQARDEHAAGGRRVPVEPPRDVVGAAAGRERRGRRLRRVPGVRPRLLRAGRGR